MKSSPVLFASKFVTPPPLLFVETLEDRIAPATLINGSTLSYQDVDGDNVTVKFSKAILTAANVNDIFKFDVGVVPAIGDNSTKQQLQTLVLTDVVAGALANGISVTISAKASKVTGGDGFVNVGFVNGTNQDLGAIKVGGDLGRILAGDAVTATGSVRSLDVQSIGVFGTSTQVGGGTLSSTFNGTLGKLIVRTDIKDARILVDGGTDGKLGSLSVGGSLIGGGTANSGSIETEGNIGAVKIAGDLQGGAGLLSGSLVAGLGSKITSITIGGSLIGGAGQKSGYIEGFEIGAIKITGDLVGSAANAQYAGAILGNNTFNGKNASIASLTIGGSLIGGVGQGSGSTVSLGDIGPVKIGGDLRGGSGNYSGSIESLIGKLSSVKIGGSLLGGNGTNTAGIIGETGIGAVLIGKEVKGAVGSKSAAIQTQGVDALIASVTIGGSLSGGSGPTSGTIVSKGDLGAVKIGGHLIGGSNGTSGSIDVTGTLASVTIRGDVLGGSSADSGSIQSTGAMGKIQIGGSVKGGTAGDTGLISSGGKLTSVIIGGALVGGTLDNTGHIRTVGVFDIGSVRIGQGIAGGAGNNSGAIHSGGNLGPVTILGDVSGGGGTMSGLIFSAGNLGAIKITGDFKGGSGSYSGLIRSDGTTASVTIGGSVLGGSSMRTGAILSSGILGPVKIAGDLQSGTGVLSVLSATIQNSTLGSKIVSISIGGSIKTIVGAGDGSAAILSLGDIGAIRITGNVEGLNGAGTANIIANHKLTALTIGGSLIGGAGFQSAYIYSGTDMGTVKIGGSIQGGSADKTGSIHSKGILAALTVGGSVIGGVNLATSFNGSGLIKSDGDMGAVKIGGNLQGSSASAAVNRNDTGSILSGGAIKSVFIGGSVIAGTDATTGTFSNNGAIRAGADIGALAVKGSLIGTALNNVLITAVGKASLPANAKADVAIGKITIGGRVELSQILAGYDTTGTGLNGNGGVNADAQIGAVSVGGNWIASSIAAGTRTGVDGFWGSGDDKTLAAGDDPGLASRIASITIKGQLLGTPGGADHFGFVAERIGGLKIGSTSISLPANPVNVTIDVGATDDVSVRLAPPVI